ncbi:tyrosine-protein phosphatase Lar-like isoform X2 [Dermacentor variabilis]|uniref:tyrosine-protein phosphatase Lar-like isoform X2 n=1 Tax=Dermacentor variabilis TaxID=34621 RepID=UPI003F5C6E12
MLLTSSQPRRNITAHRDSSSLGVKWRVPSGLKGRLDGYRTRWCQSFNCVTREQTVKDPLELSVKLSQLDPYRQYTVYMKAFTMDRSSGQKTYGTESSLVVYNMETYGPSEPIHLLIKATNSSTLLITWPKQDAYAAQFDSYSVDWSKAEPSGANGSSLHSQTLPANSTSFFLYDLEPDASYHVWLSRVNKSNDAHTGPHTLHGADGVLPEPCGKPEALGAEVRPWSNSHRVWVTWDASRSCQGSPVKRYTVKLCPVHDQKMKKDLTRCSEHMVTITDNAGVLVLEGLKNVSHYRLELRELVSREDGGSDEGQPAIVFTTTSGSGHPTRYDRKVKRQNPQGIQVEVKRYLNTSVASVTWNVSKDTEPEQSVSRYALKLCPICDDELEANITECHSIAVSASAGKAIFPALRELCEYTLEARALVEREADENDEERKPAVVTFVTPGPALPSLGDSIRAELTGNSVKLYWRKPAGLRDYGVVYDVRLFRPESNSVFVEAVVEDTEKTLFGLQPRTAYSVDVAVCVARARRLHCGGNATLYFQTRPDENSTDLLNITVEAPSFRKLQVSWNPVAEDGDLKGYNVSWWRCDPYKGCVHAGVTTSRLVNDTKLSVPELEPNTTYTVQVVAIYERKKVTWRGTAASLSATTTPDSLPPVTNISLATTNRKRATSDVTISWTTTEDAFESVVPGYHVRLCIDTGDVPGECLNETVSSGKFNATFLGIPNFAALFVSVRPVLKTPDGTIDGGESTARCTSWTPQIPGVSELVVSDVTSTSARASWSKVEVIEGLPGAHYSVVLSVEPGRTCATRRRDVGRDDRAEQRRRTSPATVNSDACEETVVRNATTSDSSIVLLDLKPWTNYTVSVTPGVIGRGLVVQGNIATEVFETPAEAPDKPRNVSVKKRGGDHYLTWLPPAQWNGPRSGYEVSVSCAHSNARANSTIVAVKADTTELKIPRLSSGAPCTLSVYAYNLYSGEPLDGEKVRVRFTPPRREDAFSIEPSTKD